ncbi:nucleoside-diphosphate kinase [Sphingomonas paeninsulae]|jgi:transcription elongation GreA/GreB family factor|uniref:Nucleoside-diphosphate kinase n=1 Tax=Sphingomonas paeninsulae TaxID=2319844 RepID=A0A494TCD7_SPHPE|nr:GreA/GreB family elongation factor [Sphingomonas paeninsulae]AYJ86820.1 nucleoside-diphosphate kinase [Sphingomonas paeninsulae]
MSVAFRRESDEEHLEPKFEVPIPPGPNLVTVNGRALIAAQVEAFERAVAEAGPVIEKTDEAEALMRVKRDLRYWRARLATAQLSPPPPEGNVGFGSRVRLRLNGAERTIDIVGGDEADPANGRLAFTAPLARALMGLGEGDFADFAGKVDAIEVLAVHFP